MVASGDYWLASFLSLYFVGDHYMFATYLIDEAVNSVHLINNWF